MTRPIRDVMTTPVVTVRMDTSFKQVVARLRAARVGAVPVIDDSGRVLGIVHGHDLLAKKTRPERSPGRLGRAGRHREHGPPTAATAAGLMTCPAVTVNASTRTDEAARLMCRHRVASLPIVDSQGRLIGIVSQGDVLDSFTRQDAEIRREVVRDVISREFMLDPLAFSVTVQDGIVTLAGQPENDLVGHLLAAAVRHVEGVIDLRDQLSYTVGQKGHRGGSRVRQPWPGIAVLALAMPFSSAPFGWTSGFTAGHRHRGILPRQATASGVINS